MFDLADTDSSCAVRFATTVPTQALTMLNGKFINDQAKVLATRLRKEAGDDPASQVALALRLTTCRPPTDAEIRRGVKFVSSMPLEYFCLVALNLDEFVYLD